MSKQFVDLPSTARSGAPPLSAAEFPLGIVFPPAEVDRAVAEEEARLAKERGLTIDETARRRLLEEWTLQHYFEGVDIAYRSTEKGPDVLAVGEKEIGALTRSLKQEELLTLRIREI